METIVTAVTDEFPYYLRPKKASFSAAICVVLFLMGLILTTEVGLWGCMYHGHLLGPRFREGLSLQSQVCLCQLARWKRDELGLLREVRSKGTISVPAPTPEAE